MLDKFDKLRKVLVSRMLLNQPLRITWQIGDAWVTYDGDQWFIGPDFPATTAEIHALVESNDEEPVLHEWENLD
jgi:murein tripeptide amidase MpaA